MRSNIIAIATVSVLGLSALPTMAQSPGGPATRNPATSAAPTTTTPRTPQPNPLAQEDLSRVKGADVYGRDDKKIGSIDTVLMNPQSKTVDRLVVKTGGVLGVGGHDVAMPVDQFSWDANREVFKVAKTGDELKSMPAWQSATAGSSDSAQRNSYGAGR